MSEAFERDIIDRLARLETKLDAHLEAEKATHNNGMKRLGAFGIGIGIGLGGSGTGLLKLLGVV